MMIFKKLLSNLILAIAASLFVGCAVSGDYDDETINYTAAELYQEAKDNLTKSNYESAIELYEKLESRFPYGPYAQRAQIEVAYAYYKYQEPESAILAANRFIKLHPQHPNVDYAYYLRGLARFDTSQSFLDRWFNQDISERDPKNARKAFEYFSELVNKYPKSRYTPDAIKRMYILRDNLAKHEIHVARYYMGRGAYLSAANRAKYVVENYQKTPSIADALALMVQAYRKLDMNKLADDALRVLMMNHPEHPATKAVRK
ncbi:MAG: outer membrane protein assembly factor BamD [Thioalkalispiraceae bacterium]|jgi:outer membrane protein assembly factor BamD